MTKICLGCGAPCSRAAAACPRCGGAPALAPGATLGVWSIQGCLSASPRAMVYAARSSGGTPAIVKVLPEPGGSRPPEHHFPGSRVAHPGLVRYLDLGRGPDGFPWAAMERLEGLTLAAAAVRDGPLPPVRAARRLAEVADALAVLHDAGIVHGSLSPGAVFLSGREREGEAARLLDFRGGHWPVGTPPDDARFVPPEVATAGTSTHRSDLWALGATAIEALGGRGAFSGEATPLTLRQPQLGIPPSLDDFLLRLLSADPLLRPRDAVEVARRLRELAASLSGVTPRPRLLSAYDPSPSAEFHPPPALGDPPIIERRREARILDAALDETEAGRGAVIWFQGDEGSGKTALGRWFVERAAARGFQAAATTGEGRGAVLGCWRAAVGALLGEGAANEGLGAPVPEADEGSDAFTAWVALSLEKVLAGAAETNRIALFVDDFTTADPVSAGFLERLCRLLEATPRPLLVVVASRPLPRSPSGELAHLHRALATVRQHGGAHRLTRMTDAEVDELIQGMSPVPLDADVRATVRRAAGGNAMLAVEVLRHLAAVGALHASGGLVRLKPGVQVSLPQGLLRLFEERLDRLREQGPMGPAALELLGRVALLGAWATPAALADLATMERRADLRDWLDPLLDRLVADGLATRVRWGDGERILLRHPMMEAPALARLGEHRQALDLAAARVLEAHHREDLARVAEDLARHYAAAGYLDRATDALLAAGRRALSRGSMAQAGRLFRRAEESLDGLGQPQDPRRGEVLESLAECLWFAGQAQEAEARIAALSRLPDPQVADSLGVLALRARIAEARQRPEEAVALWDAVTRRALEAGDPGQGAEALARRASVEMDRGRNREAGDHLAAAEALLAEDGSPGIRGLLRMAKGRLLRKVGDPGAARTCLDEAVDLLSGPRDLPDRVRALAAQAAHLLDLDRPEEALERFRMGVALCEQSGYARGLAGQLAGLGTALARTGRADEGRAAVQRALSLRESLGDRRGVGQALAALAGLAADRQEWQTVVELAGKALGPARETGYVLGERIALLALGRAELALGHATVAERHLNACLLTARQDDGPTPALGEAHLLLAAIREVGGNREAAQRHRLHAIVIFDRLELPGRADAVRQQLGRDEVA